MGKVAKQSFLKPLIGFGVVVDLIILDQITKWLVLEHVFRPRLMQESLGVMEWFSLTDRLDPVSVEIWPFLNFTMVWNEGVSFGLFQSGNPWPLTFVAVVISAIFAVWLFRSQRWGEVLPLSMVIGGALGNVVDRLHFGAVADFADFHVLGWHYPAFNVADSCITVGIIMLLINSLLLNRETKPTGTEKEE